LRHTKPADAAPDTASNTVANTVATVANTKPNTEPNANHINSVVDLNTIASHVATWSDHNINTLIGHERDRVDDDTICRNQRHIINPDDTRTRRDNLGRVVNRHCTDRWHCWRMRRIAIDHCNRAGTCLSRTPPPQSQLAI
jgi:hypothetical protein